MVGEARLVEISLLHTLWLFVFAQVNCDPYSLRLFRKEGGWSSHL